ncbi:Uncharacterized protein Rs2_28474 [Raphanus sativus]|nr:Uncharacterized protein Rs2_28474 [Raphanus sativus]
MEIGPDGSGLMELKRIVVRAKYLNCVTIFISISEGSHSACPDSPLGPDAYTKPYLFKITMNLPRKATKYLKAKGFLTLDTDDVPPGATLTAHFLYQLALKMELKLVIFSLGDVSKKVGKIYDRRVLTYTCDPQNECGHKKSTTNWTELLNGSKGEGSVLVKKWLQEALRRENISVNVRAQPGYATKPELQAMVKALSQSQLSLLRNKGIIQLAAATAASLDEFPSSKWDAAFSSAEMVLNVKVLVIRVRVWQLKSVT